MKQEETEIGSYVKIKLNVLLIFGMLELAYLTFLPREIMMLLTILGVIAIVAGIIQKESWFQFKDHGLLSRKEVEKADVRNFMRVVREELIKREEARRR